MIDRFYVDARRLPWYSRTPYTHVVRDKGSNDHIVCASTDYGAKDLASMLNSALTPYAEQSG